MISDKIQEELRYIFYTPFSIDISVDASGEKILKSFPYSAMESIGMYEKEGFYFINNGQGVMLFFKNYWNTET